MRPSLAGIAFCSALLIASAPPARADAPVVIGPLTEEGTVFFWDCGDFEVLDRYVLNVTVRRMLDRFGNRIRLIEEVWGVDTFVNSATGKEIAAPYHNNTFVDFSTGRADIAGVIFKVVVPGVGPVFMDVGLVTVDRAGNVYFSAGPHQYEDGNVGTLCEALR